MSQLSKTQLNEVCDDIQWCMQNWNQSLEEALNDWEHPYNSYQGLAQDEKQQVTDELEATYYYQPS